MRSLVVALISASAAALAAETSDKTAGQSAFLVCSACHSLEPDGPAMLGPSLYDVINRPIASLPSYEYSAALQSLEGRWDPERLNQFLADPQSYAAGTKMVLPGIKSADQRSVLIAWLNSNSSKPLPTDELPGPAVPSEGLGQQAGTATTHIGVLHPAPGASETYALCTPCHSERIVAQQGQTRSGWDELLEWMVEEQGMQVLAPSVQKTVLDYLSEHYGPDRPNLPK